MGDIQNCACYMKIPWLQACSSYMGASLAQNVGYITSSNLKK
jgi:hypothetical protein